MAILGVDVGGTFTDAVLLDGGAGLRTAEVPTARRQEESVLEAAAATAGGRARSGRRGRRVRAGA